MKEKSYIQKIIRPIDGYLSDIEGHLLYSLASSCPPKCTIVEIGSFKGKSTICLGKALVQKKQCKIYAIDPHDSNSHCSTFADFQTNIKNNRLEKVVIPLVKTSQEAAHEFNDQSLDMIFIDGDHSYEAVKQDIELWLPKLKTGGIIAFHDSFGFGFPGTRKAVHEKAIKSSFFYHVKYLDSITYAIKVDKTTIYQKLENHFRLFIKVLHEKSASKGKSWPGILRRLIRKCFWNPLRIKWLKEIQY